MDDKTPWTGGISNRQILVDSIRALAIWLAFSVPVFALLWWASGALVIAAPLRSAVGVVAPVAGFLGLGFIRFIKWRCHA
jgi:hypothetical protein